MMQRQIFKINFIIILKNKTEIFTKPLMRRFLIYNLNVPMRCHQKWSAPCMSGVSKNYYRFSRL